MVPGSEAVPDLAIVLDSSRSMEGPKQGTKTHKATLAAFKACQFAHGKGAEIAAINFSEKYLLATWTRDLNSVEDVLVEFLCTRTHIPGKAVLELAKERPGASFSALPILTSRISIRSGKTLKRLLRSESSCSFASTKLTRISMWRNLWQVLAKSIT